MIDGKREGEGRNEHTIYLNPRGWSSIIFCLTFYLVSEDPSFSHTRVRVPTQNREFEHAPYPPDGADGGV